MGKVSLSFSFSLPLSFGIFYFPLDRTNDDLLLYVCQTGTGFVFPGNQVLSRFVGCCVSDALYMTRLVNSTALANEKTFIGVLMKRIGKKIISIDLLYPLQEREIEKYQEKAEAHLFGQTSDESWTECCRPRGVCK